MRVIRNQVDSHQQSTSLPDFSSPEFLYYLHSAQLGQPALQELWLSLGHKPMLKKELKVMLTWRLPCVLFNSAG